MCRRRRRTCMRAAALEAGGPDVGNAPHAGVQSIFEGDGRGWWSGGESNAFGDRFIVALAELGGDVPPVLVRTPCQCAGR